MTPTNSPPPNYDEDEKAWMEGYDAWNAHKGREDNPYDPPTSEHEAELRDDWDEGWLEASRDLGEG